MNTDRSLECLRRAVCFLRSGCWAFGLAMLLALPVAAQEQKKPGEDTLLEVDLLMPDQASDPLAAQRWRKVFEELDQGVRIRQPLPSDHAKIEEVSRGPFRLVRLVGELSRDGKVTFPGKSFTAGQTAQLAEYLNELKTFGALGSPDGKPLWGLSRDQFSKVFDQLRPVVDKPLKNLPMGTALQLIPQSPSLPLKFHSTAESIWQAAESVPFQGELQGLSSGTALAFLLSQQGLGFRPQRTPNGDVELMVHPVANAKDTWPVGWPLPEEKTRDHYIPGIFAKVETSVQEAPISHVLSAIESRTNVRILLDRRACLAKQLDPDQTLVSYPRKKTFWVPIISHVVGNAHMSLNYRQDEAGTGFLHILPFESYVPAKKAPAPVKPTS